MRTHAEKLETKSAVDALKIIQKAIMLNPNDDNAWKNKGVILNTLGREKDALISTDIVACVDGIEGIREGGIIPKTTGLQLLKNLPSKQGKLQKYIKELDREFAKRILGRDTKCDMTI